MSKVVPATGSAVHELSELLSDEERFRFLKLLGADMSADELVCLLSFMDLSESDRFIQMISPGICAQLIPVVIRDGVKLVREHAGITDPDLEARLLKQIGDNQEAYTREIAEREQRYYKAHRDRGSLPDTIIRNAAILDRLESKPPCSVKKVAKEFDVSPKYVRDVRNEKAKWRKLHHSLESAEFGGQKGSTE